ncbi:DUF58 domain-containing protein [Thiorhodovibrio frisius]|uniref:DUF58 domain-containing protein n=1 Tax=Thiorhodovibrio frisius TaxID=631362 RepID=H8Z5M9_9GAMM|nr:DUF58 domain-containing protein [Thiorhodovibrio frisius]EIC20599.1 hypothetical protein Thi970DRAFT_04253 [Thiorhodovibrio frisius]WPL21348.1 hypothetical protein Thiofri_01473 [Thiorhodovibrio frisius]
MSGSLLRAALYPGLRRLESWQRYQRDGLTPLGRLVLAMGFAAAIFGFDTRLNQLYQLFTLALSLLLFSGLAALVDSWRLRGRVIASRELPRTACLGMALEYRVRLQVLGGRGARGLFLAERLPDPTPTRAQFRDPREGGDLSDGWFDRIMGYPRWQRLRRHNRVASPGEPIAISPLMDGADTHVRLRLVPQRRGYLRLRGLWLTRPDPLGLVRTRVSIPCEQSLLVLPMRYPAPQLRLPGRRQYQPGGWTLASAVGDSQEFIGLREYRPGDSPRMIHWPSWARSGSPQVKEYQDEFFTRHALVLDTFSASALDADFEAAVSVAASLCDRIGDADSLLDLLFVGAETYCVTGGRGLGGTGQFLEVLACAQASPHGSVAQLEQALLRRMGQLSALVLVLLGFDQARRNLVSALQASGLPLRVLAISTQPAEALNAGWTGPQVQPIHRGRIAEDLARI